MTRQRIMQKKIAIYVTSQRRINYDSKTKNSNDNDSKIKTRRRRRMVKMKKKNTNKMTSKPA